MLKSVDARKGEVVSVVDRLGGLGIGYLVAGQVWKASGSYWAVKAEEDIFGMVEYRRDGGASYLEKVKRMLG